MTLDARIERRLTVEILRGVFAPGERLPSIRALAARFSVNVNTLQRAVARLERSGLVVARQGSGVVVQDPLRAGGLELLPAWLEALADQPREAAELVEGFLEVRRALAAHFLVQRRARLVQHTDSLRAALAAVGAARDLGPCMAADLAFTERLIEVVGNPAAQLALSLAVRVLGELPLVQQAMYAVPGRCVAASAGVLQALCSADPDSVVRRRIDETLAGLDRETVRRFRELAEDEGFRRSGAA